MAGAFAREHRIDLIKKETQKTTTILRGDRGESRKARGLSGAKG